MKKLTCLLLCLAAPAALAGKSPQYHGKHHHDFTGFYLTGGIGATRADYTSTPDLLIQSPTSFFTGDYHIYATSPAGLVGLSYLHQFGEQFVLGLQATAGYTQTKADYRNETNITQQGGDYIDVSSQLEVELTNDFALLFKPGIVSYRNTLFYGLAGARWGNFNTTINTIAKVNQGGRGMASGSASESGYQLGFTAGLGMQQMLTDHVQVSLEYAYTHYGEIDSPTVIAYIIPASDNAHLSDTREVDATTNAIMLAVSYQF